MIPALLRMEWLGELGLLRLLEAAQLESVVARFLARSEAVWLRIGKVLKSFEMLQSELVAAESMSQFGQELPGFEEVPRRIAMVRIEPSRPCVPAP